MSPSATLAAMQGRAFRLLPGVSQTVQSPSWVTINSLPNVRRMVLIRCSYP